MIDKFHFPIKSVYAYEVKENNFRNPTLEFSKVRNK